jgi:hypothetical protein
MASAMGTSDCTSVTQSRGEPISIKLTLLLMELISVAVLAQWLARKRQLRKSIPGSLVRELTKMSRGTTQAYSLFCAILVKAIFD